jgi:hypothetical protein
MMPKFEKGDRVLIWVTSEEEALVAAEAVIKPVTFDPRLIGKAHASESMLVLFQTIGGYYVVADAYGERFYVDGGWLVPVSKRERAPASEGGLCSCPLELLMREGCRCGAVVRYDASGWVR